MYEQLIIAEKPSMGRNIAQVLFKSNKEKDGYIECEGGRFAVTWTIGHLVELAYPEEYDEKYKTWRIEDLPIIPDKYKLVVSKSTSKQFYVIRELGKRANSIVNACDSGREGELIFFYTAVMAGLSNKPTKRLWTSSVTEEGIRNAYRSMQDAKEYKNLLNSAIVRSRADWLIGINATRAFTVKVGAGDLLPIGRVKAPVVAMIYDRCKAIEEFEKKTYYVIEAEFEQGEMRYKGLLEQKTFDEKQEGELIAEEVRYELGSIQKCESEIKKVYAPSLYNLTSLTSEANKKFGYSATEVLELAQYLYENKYITYPRTNSNYVTKNEISMMRRVFEVLSQSTYQPLFYKADIRYIDERNKRICNEKYVDDHHAILPTGNVPKKLGKKEKNIYELIVKRFVAQCYPPAEYLAHTIKTEVKGHVFHTSVRELKKIGWKALYGEDEHDEDVIKTPFHIKDHEPVRCVECETVKKVTQPPKPYTEGSLIVAMETAGKELEDPKLREAMKDAGLGTPATRAPIIESVKKDGYVKLEGKSLYITDKGRFLIETLRKTKIKGLTSAEYTGGWERRLNQISKGEFSSKKFLEHTEKFTEMIVEEAGKQNLAIYKPSIAECPACKVGQIVANRNVFGCTRWKDGCEFKIWKRTFGRELKDQEVNELITKGETPELVFVSKNKKKYKAKLILVDRKTGEVKLEFSNQKIELGTCLKCKKGKIVDRGKFLGCSMYPDCNFTFSKTIKSKSISHEQLAKLFTQGQTDIIEGFIQDDGTCFSARIVLSEGKFLFSKT